MWVVKTSEGLTEGTKPAGDFLAIGWDTEVGVLTESDQLGINEDFIKFYRRKDAEIATKSLNEKGITLQNMNNYDLKTLKKIMCEHLQW